MVGPDGLELAPDVLNVWSPDVVEVPIAEEMTAKWYVVLPARELSPML